MKILVHPVARIRKLSMIVAEQPFHIFGPIILKCTLSPLFILRNKLVTAAVNGHDVSIAGVQVKELRSSENERTTESACKVAFI